MRRILAFVAVVTALVLVARAVMGGDHSNVAELQRASTATHAVVGSIDGAGFLSMERQEPLVLGGEPMASSMAVVDLFDYEPEVGRTYELLARVSAGDGSQLGEEGDILLLYVHDPVTDEPADGHPDTKTESGKTARDVLDCLVELRRSAETRFDTLAAVIAQDSGQLWDCS